VGGVRNTDPDTCRKAFEQMKEDGTLSRRRLEAIACLSGAAEPTTVGEMAKHMQTNRNNLATRMSELEHLGVVYKHGERPCAVTKKECITWWMTGDQPSGEIPKNINTTEIIRNQRDKAQWQAIELLALLNSVSDWLEAPEQNLLGGTANKRAGARIKQRIEELKKRRMPNEQD
jgi:DNA-binding transcriptional regulator YhcF (GntR family)